MEFFAKTLNGYIAFEHFPQIFDRILTEKQTKIETY